MGSIIKLFEALAEVWLLALVLLIVAISIVGIRRVGLAVALALAALLVLAVIRRLTTEPMPDADLARQQLPSTPGVPVVSVPIDAVQALALDLSGSGAPFDFSGRIVNNSTDLTLVSITFDLERLDCYEQALDPSGCEVLWRGEKTVYLTVPPGEERRFAIAVWARDSVPKARGSRRDVFEIASASGRRTEPASGAEDADAASPR